MKQVEIKREIRRKVLQWQELGAGKWSPAVDIKTLNQNCVVYELPRE